MHWNWKGIRGTSRIHIDLFFPENHILLIFYQFLVAEISISLVVTTDDQTT